MAGCSYCGGDGWHLCSYIPASYADNPRERPEVGPCQECGGWHVASYTCTAKHRRLYPNFEKHGAVHATVHAPDIVHDIVHAPVHAKPEPEIEPDESVTDEAERRRAYKARKEREYRAKRRASEVTP